jgi:hypothetical protein
MRGSFFAGLWGNPKPFFLTIAALVLSQAVNKFLEEKLKEKGIYVFRLTIEIYEKLKTDLLVKLGFRAMSYNLTSRKI